MRATSLVVLVLLAAVACVLGGCHYGTYGFSYSSGHHFHDDYHHHGYHHHHHHHGWHCD